MKSLAPMVLAAIFVFTAANFMSTGIKKKADRKVAFVGAIIIEIVSFTIWIPCFNDLFNAIGLTAATKPTAMIIAVALVLLGTAITTILGLKQKET